MRKIDTVLFDMDGTIVDFESEVKIRTGTTVLTHNAIDSSWIDAYLEREVPNKLFHHMNPLPDFEVMKHLIVTLDSMGKKVAFLSSCTHQWFDEIVEQKRFWLDKHGLSKYDLYGVQHSHEKGNYAHEGALLIDDYHVSVDAFRKNGGTAIKHVNANLTYFQLKNLEVI